MPKLKKERDYEAEIEALKKRIEVLEEFMAWGKQAVEEKRKGDLHEKRTKWLKSYPDESEVI